MFIFSDHLPCSLTAADALVWPEVGDGSRSFYTSDVRGLSPGLSTRSRAGGSTRLWITRSIVPGSWLPPQATALHLERRSRRAWGWI